MNTTPYRKLIETLGDTWRVIDSTYEDGPPPRKMFLKQIPRKFLWFTTYPEHEVAWMTSMKEIRTRAIDIANELEDANEKAQTGFIITLV